MASLKDIRNRKKSVQSTKKITSAMKMVAAAKLRKYQDQVVAARPYGDLMSNMLSSLVEKAGTFEEPPKLLVGTGRDHRHMIVVITSDRGLCGSYNAIIIREAKRQLQKLQKAERPFQILCIGRRGRNLLISEGYGQQIIGTFSAPDKVTFLQAKQAAQLLLDKFEDNEFDVCTMIYNRFISAINQEITLHTLVPYSAPLKKDRTPESHPNNTIHALYEYEPDEVQVLSALLPKNFAVQIYEAMLENIASEQGARMTAMDSATRNADDMIKKLDLHYNRTRQALVTSELIEIISGAEAL